MSKKCKIISTSLVQRTAKPDVVSSYYHSFCLGIPEWCPCCIKMEDSRKSLSLKRAHGKPVKENEKKQKENTVRFLFDIDADDLSKYKKGSCPHNTEKNTEWALRNFEAWQIARNHKYPKEQCSTSVLTTANKTELCEWLCKFSCLRLIRVMERSILSGVYIYYLLVYRGISGS